MKVDDLISDLNKLSSFDRAKSSAWYFKTEKGQYGYGDKFIGISVPEQRKVAKKYKDLSSTDIIGLLHSPIHEHRLTALFILVIQYKQGDEKTKDHIASIYLKNRKFVNNWDLVDSSAPYILGDYLKTHSSNVLFSLAKSKSIWDRRIAIISTFAFIKDSKFELSLNLSTILLDDKEDLIHKAVGWTLREVGKKEVSILLKYLDQQTKNMPRTSLRYAIERLSPEQKQYYMNL